MSNENYEAEIATLRLNLAEAERSIAQLAEAVKEAAAVIDRYRAALWEIRDGRDASAAALSHVALLALAGAKESEAK